MIFYVLCRLLSALFVFLFPAYASFKALSRRPVTEPELERWVMYWTVVGIIVAIEYSVEWLVSWFPFYWEVKTLFLLFLALPQTQGSTLVYKNYLEPVLRANERLLDDYILQAQANVFAFLRNGLASLWEKLVTFLNARAGQTASGQPGAAPGAAGQPGGLMGMWKTYGPAITATANQYIGSSKSGEQPQAPVAPRVYSSSSSLPPNLPPLPTPTPSERPAPTFPVPEVSGYKL